MNLSSLTQQAITNTTATDKAVSVSKSGMRVSTGITAGFQLYSTAVYSQFSSGTYIDFGVKG